MAHVLGPLLILGHLRMGFFHSGNMSIVDLIPLGFMAYAWFESVHSHHMSWNSDTSTNILITVSFAVSLWSSLMFTYRAPAQQRAMKS